MRICSNHHSAAYCQTVEAIYGVEVPERARIIRTITMECQRITSHLLALGHIAEVVGYENLFMQCFRERELVMRLVNEITGNRVHYSTNVIGGVKRDIDAAMERRIEDVMSDLRPRLEELHAIFSRDSTFVKRAKGIGKLTREQAIDWCVVGPVARASGVAQDVREDGFAAYDRVRLRPVVREEGDCYARTMVRMDECLRSVDLIEECLPLLKGRLGGPERQGTSKRRRHQPGGGSARRTDVLCKGHREVAAGPGQDPYARLRQRACRPGHVAWRPACRCARDHGVVGPLHMLHGPVMTCRC